MSHPFLPILMIAVASINSVHNWHKPVGNRYKQTLPDREASPTHPKPVKRHTVSEKNVRLPGRFADLPHGKSTVLFRLGHFIRRNDATPPCLGGGRGDNDAVGFPVAGDVPGTETAGRSRATKGLCRGKEERIKMVIRMSGGAVVMAVVVVVMVVADDIHGHPQHM